MIDSRQNAATASQGQSVEHRKLHLRSRGCGRRADASVLPRRRAWRPRGNTRASASPAVMRVEADLKVRLYDDQQFRLFDLRPVMVPRLLEQTGRPELLA